MSDADRLAQWFAGLVGTLPAVAMPDIVRQRQRAAIMERCAVMRERSSRTEGKDSRLHGGNAGASPARSRASLMDELRLIDRRISRLERDAEEFWGVRWWDAYKGAREEIWRLDAQRRDVRRALKAPRLGG